jgi:hypothetical protein
VTGPPGFCDGHWELTKGLPYQADARSQQPAQSAGAEGQYDVPVPVQAFRYSKHTHGYGWLR